MDVNGEYPEKNALMDKYQEILLSLELDPGATGSAVKSLQGKLLYLGFDLGGYGATGTFGKYTESALKAIQEYEGFEVVGRYGPKTRVAVEELVRRVEQNGNYPEKDSLMNLYKKYISTFSIQDTFVDISGSLVSEIGYAYYDQEDPSLGSIMYGSNSIA